MPQYKLHQVRLKNRLYQLIHDSNVDDKTQNPLLVSVSDLSQTVEEITAQLKDQFPEYKRMPSQGLLRKVKITLARQFQVEFVNGSYFERSDVIKDKAAQYEEVQSEDDPLPRPTANLINRTMLPYGVHNNAKDETKPESSSKEEEEELEPEIKKKKKNKRTDTSSQKPSLSKFQQSVSSVRYSDLGGVDNLISEIKQLVEFPLKHASVFHHLGVQPSKGVLLEGPTGTGKTTFAMAICGEVGVPFFKISAPQIISGLSGESQQNLRNLFTSAQEVAPSIIFIDQIDSIAGKRESALKELEKRVVAQFITCVDELNAEKALKDGKIVIVIAATSQPEVIDTSLRATGRFDRELSLPIPSEAQRLEILKVVTRKMKTEGSIDFLQIARLSPGYVAADLVALAKEAAMSAIRRKFSYFFGKGEPQSPNDLTDLEVTEADFKVALKKVQPSAKRQGFTTVPATTWEDVGALEDIKLELQRRIVDPIKHPEIFAKAKVESPSGVLLYGPPGCGKTLLAKAVSNESRANFISVKGPELLNKYVGESEKAVRGVFARARNSAPCVVFFDELDALCPRRDGENSSSQVTQRVVNQLLVELAGLQERKQVFIIGATNRLDIIDEAMLRPGRLEKQLYVGLPSKQGRYCILKTLTRDKPISPDINLTDLAERVQCEGLSGADLAGLVKEASMLALQQTLERMRANPSQKQEAQIQIEEKHFNEALLKVKPSVKSKKTKY